MATKYGNALVPIGGGPNGVQNVNAWQYIGAAGATDTIQMSQSLNELIPAFTTLFGWNLTVSAHNTGSPACNIGYASTDGDATTTNATDLTYFASALAISAAGKYGFQAANSKPPRTIPKDAWPVITMSGAALTATTLTLTISSRYDGSP